MAPLSAAALLSLLPLRNLGSSIARSLCARSPFSAAPERSRESTFSVAAESTSTTALWSLSRGKG